MYWFQVGCCGYILAVASFSVALNPDLQVSQRPRFYGVKTRRTVVIHCLCTEHSLPVQWYKASRYNIAPAERRQVLTGQRVSMMGKTPNRAASIILQNVDIEDSSVYFCKMNNTWGPGTELQVFRPINIDNTVYRSKMKDGLIFIQGLMLAMCIAAALIHNHLLLKKQEAIYEEPDIDHIYEGLAIGTCGGDIYQDISVYTEPEGAGASWERD